MPMPAGAMLFNFLGHVRSAFLCERDGCDFPSELGLAAGGAPSSCSHFCAQSAVPGQT